MPDCQHERLHQFSEAMLRTTWERNDDGSYEPDAEYKVLDETIGLFVCVDCGDQVELDTDARIEQLA
jgi:hypothetical protein